MTSVSAHSSAAVRGVSTAIQGWMEAAGFVLAVGALSLLYAVGSRLHCHPIAFVLYATLVSGIVTTWATAVGGAGFGLMVHPLSWLIGAASILVEVFYYLMLSLGLPAHGNIILRSGIPLAMIVGYMLGRRPHPLAATGAFGIAIAAASATMATPAGGRLAMVCTSLAGAIFIVVRAFAMEFHPCNRVGGTLRDKLRLSGIIVLITSIVGIALTAIATLSVGASLVAPTPLIPSVSQLFHVPTVLLAGTAGGCMLTIMTYFNLSAVGKIRAENFVVMTAFTPVSAWVFLEFGAVAGWVTVRKVETDLFLSLATLGTSVVLILYAAKRRSRLQIDSRK